MVDPIDFVFLYGFPSLMASACLWVPLGLCCLVIGRRQCNLRHIFIAVLAEAVAPLAGVRIRPAVARSNFELRRHGPVRKCCSSGSMREYALLNRSACKPTDSPPCPCACDERQSHAVSCIISLTPFNAAESHCAMLPGRYGVRFRYHGHGCRLSIPRKKSNSIARFNRYWPSVAFPAMGPIRPKRDCG